MNLKLVITGVVDRKGADLRVAHVVADFCEGNAKVRPQPEPDATDIVGVYAVNEKRRISAYEKQENAKWQSARHTAFRRTKNPEPRESFIH